MTEIPPRGSVAYPGPKWSVVRVLDLPRVPPSLRGRWLVYPPNTEWGSHLDDFKTWEEAFACAFTMSCSTAEPARGFTVEAADFHRNGVGGQGFNVAIVNDPEEGRMLVIDFNTSPGEGTEYGYTAVLNLDKAAEGNIYMHPEEGKPGTGGNAWRGDRLGDLYRPLIQAERDAAWQRTLDRIRRTRGETL